MYRPLTTSLDQAGTRVHAHAQYQRKAESEATGTSKCENRIVTRGPAGALHTPVAKLLKEEETSLGDETVDGQQRKWSSEQKRNVA